MFKLFAAIIEIIGGIIAVCRRIRQTHESNAEVIERVKNAIEIRNNSIADDELLLPPDQRGK